MKISPRLLILLFMVASILGLFSAYHASRRSVFVIGDSISTGYRSKLPNYFWQADFEFPDGNSLHTFNILQNILPSISERSFDLVILNSGLHDVKRFGDGDRADQIDPKIYQFQDRMVAPEEYAKNLASILNLIRDLAPNTLFVLTTSIGPNAVGRSVADFVAYNQIARAVAEDRGTCIFDPNMIVGLQETQLLDDVHFSPEGYEILAEHIADAAMQCLASAD